MALGKNLEYNAINSGSMIILPILFRLLGRISSEKEGKGTEMFGGKKNGGGEE